MSNKIQYTLIDNAEKLQAFYEQHQSTTWIAFDTEFISEKRYYPQLCLIQVASEHGYFLIDNMAFEGLEPFLKLITDENILKVTHAGNNDYRLFYQVFGILPKSIYDIQIAAGFVGYRYPIALHSIVASQLGININKGQKVSNWAERPITNAQIQYALLDVLHLKEIMDKINAKLEKSGRISYALEEMKSFERESFYMPNLAASIAKSNTLLSLPSKSQIFYIRLYQWREAQAQAKNITRNMILDNKMMTFMAKNIKHGLKALQSHRHIPKKLVFREADMLMGFYDEPMSDEEKALLNKLPKSLKNQTQLNILFDQIDIYIRYIGMQSGISPSLILSRTELNKMKVEVGYITPEIKDGWRKELLGDDILNWLANRNQIQMNFNDGALEVKA